MLTLSPVCLHDPTELLMWDRKQCVQNCQFISHALLCWLFSAAAYVEKMFTASCDLENPEPKSIPASPAVLIAMMVLNTTGAVTWKTRKMKCSDFLSVFFFFFLFHECRHLCALFHNGEQEYRIEWRTSTCTIILSLFQVICL